LSTSKAKFHARRALRADETNEKLDELARAIHELARALRTPFPTPRTGAAKTRAPYARPGQYDAAYFARQHRISAAEARTILRRAGASREKAVELVRASKKAANLEEAVPASLD
jgi:hypothetical protein